MLQKTIADADGLTGCVIKSSEKDGDNPRVNDYICKNAVFGLYNKSWGKEQKSGQSKPNQVKWKCKNPQLRRRSSMKDIAKDTGTSVSGVKRVLGDRPKLCVNLPRGVE